jgi:signal transduction histidine kinase
LAELQAKYELQKKETTILHQQYDLARKNELVIGSIGLLAAVLILGYFYFQNRKKNQRLKLQTLEMEQKKKTTQAVMQAEEQERKRIAGELHDSVAQKMVVAKISLEALTNHAQQMNEKEKKIFSNVQTLLEESTTEIRNLSHIMMPQILALAGLSETVKSFLDKVEQADLKINFSSEGDFTAIPENTALMIYRVIQEAVQNVLKHASATKLDVSMICENNEVDVIIEDNGVGFNTSANDIAAGNGLANLRSRIAFLNGKLDINSTAGSGTIIAFYIPLI